MESNSTAPEAEAIVTPEEFDPWAIENLRISQANLNARAAETKLTNVPVRRPSKHEFILKEERETYIVFPYVVQQLPTNVQSLLEPHTLYLAINRQEVVFIWPIRHVDPARTNRWLSSAHEAAAAAEDNWIRVSSNQSLGSYEQSIAETNYGDPQWPVQPINQILKVAFGDKAINSPDHKLILHFRGKE
jgi:hypothetical protein